MALNVKELQFYASFETLDDFQKRSPYKDKDQIAIVGRSNVGKSSLINHFFQNKNLAKVSKKPGKTRLLNFFVNPNFLFVDLPGYGFAKPGPLRLDWGKTIDTYLSKNERLRCLLFLLDIRRDPSKEDLMMFEWLQTKGTHFILVLTKIDKVPKAQLLKRTEEILTSLSPEKTINPVHYSVNSHSGKEILAKELKKLWD